MHSKFYHIRCVPAQRAIWITFDQLFWDVSVAEAFATDCLAAVASLGCKPGEHDILVDLRNAVLQGQEVYAKMQALIGSATARRIALVASTPLARMQTKRLQIRENIIMFAELNEAADWLRDGNRLAA